MPGRVILRLRPSASMARLRFCSSLSGLRLRLGRT